MFDEDAEASRERAQRGQKNAEFRNLYECVKLEIKNEADAGNCRATFRSSRKSTEEFVEPLVDRLTEEGYAVTAEESDRHIILDISWEDADS